MSPRKAKAAKAKPRSKTAAAAADLDAIKGVARDVRTLARCLFELSEQDRWRGEAVKSLRLSFDLGAELAKLQERAERNVSQAEWEDRQPDLPLEDDDNDA